MEPQFAAVAIFLPVLMLSLFTFLSVASWADAHRREREAFYRGETIKKVADSSGPGATAAIEILREEERAEDRRRREGQKLGGFITLAVGAGLMIFLRAIDSREAAYLAGLIPIFVGVALLGYVFLSAERGSGHPVTHP
jgi:hypothetical protein